MQNEKSFVVGGVKFSAIRHSRPIPHWRIRTDENGTEFEPGTGGISTKSVPKMIADVEEVFTRLSKGDANEFRRNFKLPLIAEGKSDQTMNTELPARTVVLSTAPLSCTNTAAANLEAHGTFKGAHGIEGLLNASEFWEKQPYGTRLYYGAGAADYLHIDVLRAAVKLLTRNTIVVATV